jgi:hypothetical protein
MATLSNVAPSQSQGRAVSITETLGTNAREAMIDIFRKKDLTVVDRYFGESFIRPCGHGIAWREWRRMVLTSGLIP